MLVIPVSLTLLLATAFLILQMKKLRHRVARGLVQCHMANDWGCQDLNPDSPPQGFPHGSVVKNLPANAGDAGSIPGLGEGSRCRFDPWRRAWQPTPVFLPGKSH